MRSALNRSWTAAYKDTYNKTQQEAAAVAALKSRCTLHDTAQRDDSYRDAIAVLRQVLQDQETCSARIPSPTGGAPYMLGSGMSREYPSLSPEALGAVAGLESSPRTKPRYPSDLEDIPHLHLTELKPVKSEQLPFVKSEPADDAGSITSSSQTPVDDFQSSYFYRGKRHCSTGDIPESPTSTTSQSFENESLCNLDAKQPFVPCKVCGDKASGFHYGVTSCEGCKGFFRRSIQKQIEYRCLRDGKCMVIRLNRNRCQYCRFKKCLAVGMSRDSVRFGRVPRRCKIAEENAAAAGPEALSQKESRQLAIYDVILGIGQAHHSHCELTKEKVKALKQRPCSLLEPDEDEVEGETAEETEHRRRLNMWQHFAAKMSPSIQQVVEFAKRLPGFADLSQEDQLILIKASFFDLWLLRMARMFCLDAGSVTFADGSVVPREELELVYSVPVVSSWFEFCASFTQLRLQDNEVGLVSAVAVASPTRPGLTNVAGVQRVRERMLEALQLQLERNHSSDPELFARLGQKLGQLQMIGATHTKCLAYFRGLGARMDSLPPLFAEIFDFPKADDVESESDMHEASL